MSTTAASSAAPRRAPPFYGLVRHIQVNTLLCSDLLLATGSFPKSPSQEKNSLVEPAQIVRGSPTLNGVESRALIVICVA